MTVAVDGATRYVWPVSTGRAGYDTPNGTFKVNRMHADHLSQEWDNAPMRRCLTPCSSTCTAMPFTAFST
jgi:lipoprotein-anchoring transpeptidase ErfK/SrfK